MSPDRIVPEAIVATAQRYKWFQWLLLYGHYTIGIVGVAAGVVPAKTGNYAFAGWIAAFATGIITFLGLKPMGLRYKRAQARLDSAILRFQTLPDTTVEWLVSEYEQTRAFIAAGDTPTSGKAPSGDGAPPSSKS